MKTIRLIALFTLPLISIGAVEKTPAPLTAEQSALLFHYEAIRAALAQDDLSGVRQAAAAIKAQPAAARIAQATDLDFAREAFQALSTVAVDLARGRTGYFVAFCPMVPNDRGYWIQLSRRISNPYLGSNMPRCGSIED